MQKVQSISLVFGHRGMSAFAPENTLTAFKMAFDSGADGIELDVQLSKDNEVIVFHDYSLKRIAGLRKNINELSLAEIKTIDVGKMFDEKFTGEKIPTLREVFESSVPDKIINIELKGSNKDLVDRVLLLIDEYKNQSQIIISSFNIKLLEKLKQKNPEIKIGLLALPSIAGFWNRKIRNHYLKPDALHVYYKDVNAKMIMQAHKIGQKLNTYTVNDPLAMKVLFAMNVDMIITNDPALGIKVRENM